MSLSCVRAPLEPPPHLDQHPRNLGWARQGLSGAGAVPSLGGVQPSPAPQRPEIPTPREGADVESEHKMSHKETTNPGKAPQPWAGFGEGCCGSSFRPSWLCLPHTRRRFLFNTPCSAGFSEFLVLGDHKFLCFWSATFSSSSALLPNSLGATGV